MKQIIKNTITALGMTIGMYAGTLSAQDLSIQPAFNLKDKYLTTRLEGFKKEDNLSFYGFLDMSASKQKPLDIESYYGEFRVNKELTDKIGLAAEYNGGTGLSDKLRLGITYTHSLGDKNFTLMKIYPLETGKERDFQASIFSSQKISDNVNVSMLVDYNIASKTLYLEPTLNLKVKDKLYLQIQGKSFSSIDDKIRMKPLLGLKYEF